MGKEKQWSKTLVIKPHDKPFKKRGKAQGSVTVFVGNLDFEEPPLKEELMKLFEHCGKVGTVDTKHNHSKPKRG